MYIPFSNCFPELTRFLWEKEKNNPRFKFNGIIDQNTPYGDVYQTDMLMS